MYTEKHLLIRHYDHALIYIYIYICNVVHAVMILPNITAN